MLDMTLKQGTSGGRKFAVVIENTGYDQYYTAGNNTGDSMDGYDFNVSLRNYDYAWEKSNTSTATSWVYESTNGLTSVGTSGTGADGAHNSSGVIYIKTNKACTITYKSSGQNGYFPFTDDYAYAYKWDDESASGGYKLLSVTYGTGNSGYFYQSYTSTAGEKFAFIYSKDGSGDANQDRAYITITKE
jgi:hypothetical protein